MSIDRYFNYDDSPRPGESEVDLWRRRAFAAEDCRQKAVGALRPLAEENAGLRARLAAVSEELDKPTDLCPPGAKRDRRYASRVIADLEEPR